MSENQSPRRVLYLLRYYPTLTETFIYREIAGLAQRGVQVEIAALGRRKDGSLQDEAPQVPVHRVPRRPLVGRLQAPGPGQRWLADHQRAKDVARLPWLARLVTRRKIDWLHIHFAGEAAELARALWLELGVPYTVMVHAVDLFKPRPAIAQVLADARAVLAISSYHAQLLQERYQQPARVVRCGVDLSRFSDCPLPGDPLQAIFIGRDVPKKGLSDLLAAWGAARPPGGCLHLVTDRVGVSQPGVICHGLQPPSAVVDLLARANLVVLPCRRAPDGDMDGVPVVLMEGLARGRPALSTTIAGIPELIDEQVGWLVPPQDIAALGHALREASSDSARRVRGRRARALLAARGFTLDSQLDGVLRSWGRG